MWCVAICAERRFCLESPINPEYEDEINSRSSQ